MIRLLLLIRQILLHHSSNLSISVEVLTHCALLVERSADFLGCATDGSIRCVFISISSLNHRVLPICPRYRDRGRGGRRFHGPLNIEPTAPSFENMLPPVPVVLSPAAGCMLLAFLE